MKVGILTFHNAYNYGAILQTYATQELVKSFGYEVEVIDYHNKAIDYHYDIQKFSFKTLPKRYCHRIPSYLIQKFFFWKRRKAYHKFINENIKLSPSRYYQGDSFSFDSYDIILIGSDQVWNKNITEGFDDVYWGSFSSLEDTKKVAWSVCMNTTKLSEEDEAFISRNLKNFDNISVREDTLQTLISKYTEKKIFHTLDPTIALSSQAWDGLCHEVKEKNYIVVYAIEGERETIDFARKLSKILNKRIVILRSYSQSNFTEENKEYGGPIEFLSYIKMADFVVSTSFHGTVFSIIFKKQFVCPLVKENERVKSLLHNLDLSDRLVKFPEDVEKLNSIDYERVKNDIDKLRINTLNFLNEALNGTQS